MHPHLLGLSHVSVLIAVVSTALEVLVELLGSVILLVGHIPLAEVGLHESVLFVVEISERHVQLVLSNGVLGLFFLIR